MKPHIKRINGVWTVFAIIHNSVDSMPLLMAYLFAVRLNGETLYTPVKFV